MNRGERASTGTRFGRCCTTAVAAWLAFAGTNCHRVHVQQRPVAEQARPGCRAVGGLQQLLQPRRFLLFGETHGTVEAPAFIGDVVCEMAAAGAPVLLALELPASEQGRIDTFLASGGDTASLRALTDGPFWSRVQDGRTSYAMVQLIDRVRSLRRAGARLSVVAFDVPPELWESMRGMRRDSAMADALVSASQRSPGAAVVVLVGSVHAARVRGLPWDSTYVPLGAFLRTRVGDERVRSFAMTYAGGSAWQCREDASGTSACREYPLRPGPTAPTWNITVDSAAESTGWSGRWAVGPITASPPARKVLMK